MLFVPGIFDMLNNEGETAADYLQCGKFDCVISTLVLEYLTADLFFRNVAEVLLPGGHALITNMHSSMGKINEAGFTNQMLAEKFLKKSYNHSIEDVLEAAKKYGMKVVNEIGNDKYAEVKRFDSCAEKWVGM